MNPDHALLAMIDMLSVGQRMTLLYLFIATQEHPEGVIFLIEDFGGGLEQCGDRESDFFGGYFCEERHEDFYNFLHEHKKGLKPYFEHLITGENLPISIFKESVHGNTSPRQIILFPSRYVHPSLDFDDLYDFDADDPENVEFDRQVDEMFNLLKSII